MSLLAVFLVVLTELVIVGWVDLKSRKISNYWIPANVLMSVGMHFLFPEIYPVSWEVLIFPVGFVVIGFFFFLLGIMGAGDSKFIASLFLLIPLEYHMLFFGKLIFSTMLTGAILLLWKVAKNRVVLKSYFVSHYWIGIRETIKSKFSYAPVLVAAWILLGLDLWR